MLIRNTTMRNLIDKHPEAGLIRNKYKAIATVLKKVYPVIDIPIDKLEGYIYDAIHLDREWRKITEGNEVKTKQKLSKQWLDKHYANKI